MNSLRHEGFLRRISEPAHDGWLRSEAELLAIQQNLMNIVATRVVSAPSCPTFGLAVEQGEFSEEPREFMATYARRLQKAIALFEPRLINPHVRFSLPEEVLTPGLSFNLMGSLRRNREVAIFVIALSAFGKATVLR